MNEITANFNSIQQVADTYLSNPAHKSHDSFKNDVSFEDVLKERLSDRGDIKFSKHAVNRLDERNISLSDEQNVRLRDGILRAEEKGINDSLMIMDSLTFIVNVPNQTVVTALDHNDANADVFTNIDGAVFC